MPYYGHPDNDAPEFHLADEPFTDEPPVSREKLRALEAALNSLCPFCGRIHSGLCDAARNAPLTPANLLRIGKMLEVTK